MYLSDAIAVIARRWWLVLLGAIVTVTGTGAVFSMVATQYQATGQVLLLPPTARITGDEELNPYLNLPDGLTLTAALLASHAAGLDTQAQLEAEGFDSTYLVSVLPGTGPLISVSVNDIDPQAALDQRDRLITIITDRLSQLQADEAVSPGQLIKARDVTSASDAEVLAGARLRAASVVGILGVLVTLLATFGFDRLRSRGGRGRPAADLAVGPQLVVLADAQPRPEQVARSTAAHGDAQAVGATGGATAAHRTMPPVSARPRRMRPPLPVPTPGDQTPPPNGQRGLRS